MRKKSNKRNWITLILLLPVILTFQGCIYLVVGGLGAFGGYAVSSDTVEGITEADELSLWDASLEILSIMGNVIEAQEEGGIIIANVQGTKITINIMPLDAKNIKFSVKARKNFLPQISTAQDVYIKIMNKVTGI